MAFPSRKAARPFTMVRRSLWASERFASLPDDDCRYQYLYLLTCAHQTSSGCMVLKEAYAIDDLSMTGAAWDSKKWRRCLKANADAGLILSDDKTREVLITRWWNDNSPSNESWFTGARKQCEAIQSPDLRKAAQDALEACWQEFLAIRTPAARPADLVRTLNSRMSVAQ